MTLRPLLLPAGLSITGLLFLMSLATAARAPRLSGDDLLTGPQVPLEATWVGRRREREDVAILVLAGHADSQGIEGAGTSGAAVDRRGAAPMDPRMRDELFWNRKIRDAVVRQGQARCLRISGYEPNALTIRDENDPRTNWSVGRRHHKAGGYALEIHFDAYGPDGYGSGLIPNLKKEPSRIDESLALNFGRYPLQFRGGLGAPKRGISILEIGKLEGNLEARLRDPASQEAVIEALALRVVEALEQGLNAPTRSLSSQHCEDGSDPQGKDHRTSPAAG